MDAHRANWVRELLSGPRLALLQTQHAIDPAAYGVTRFATDVTDVVRLESGGGADASYVRHVFDGTRYVARERLAVDTVPDGTRHLVGEFTFDEGIPLEPPEGR